MTNKVTFSGIQPSGNLHIGNYIGGIKHWVEGQDDGMNIFCVVDMHAITVPQDPKALREKTRELLTMLVACGIDPNKSLLFVQSHNPDHANLGWILNCVASMGQMNRMTQFKDKSEDKDFVSVGLFDYPVLMAADILLYDTTHVPVGEDQKQHVELARDLAERFNSKFGETFVLPTAVIAKAGARVMSLQNPLKKMSKSDTDPRGAIGLLDSIEDIRSKVMAAVTDSGSEITYDINRPGLFNLVEIYSQMANKSTAEVVESFSGKGYKEFKFALAELIQKKLEPIQNKFLELKESAAFDDTLKQNAQKAREISSKKLSEVKERIGFWV
jgi:tryptophanyl-tRNA synthetase